MHNIPRNFTLDEKKQLAREQTRLKYKQLKESLLQNVCDYIENSI